jgi:ABC-2 type transport system ATP-binding protein
LDILTIESLSHSSGAKHVLDGVDLSVPEGSVYGFLGANGSGKTTTMKIVLGLLNPAGGRVAVLGEAVHYGGAATNRHIGYLPDVPAFYGYMRPLEYLTLCGAVSGMDKDAARKRAGELLELVSLSRNTGEKIKGFSRGMFQRLGIAQALLHEPRLLLCDEPTSALDPAGRKEILDLLLAARSRTTVIFSTHILSDVERICDRAAVLHGGKIVLEGTLADIKARHEGKERSDGYAVTVSHPEARSALRRALAAEMPSARVRTEDDVTNVVFGDAQEGGVQLIALLARLEIVPDRFELREPTLESLFLEVTDR